MRLKAAIFDSCTKTRRIFPKGPSAWPLTFYVLDSTGSCSRPTGQFLLRRTTSNYCARTCRSPPLRLTKSSATLRHTFPRSIDQKGVDRSSIGREDRHLL